jgi:hypothetical protein
MGRRRGEKKKSRGLCVVTNAHGLRIVNPTDSKTGTSDTKIVERLSVSKCT